MTQETNGLWASSSCQQTTYDPPLTTLCGLHANDITRRLSLHLPAARLSQRGRKILRVTEYFTKSLSHSSSLEITPLSVNPILVLHCNYVLNRFWDLQWSVTHIIWCWMSLKMVPFKSSGTLSYSRLTVTMALSCIISETKRDIGRKSRISHPPAFDAPVTP